MVAELKPHGYAGRVNYVELDIFCRNELLYVNGQMLFKLILAPVTVQKEGSAFLKLAYYIVLTEEALVVARHEFGMLYEIASPYLALVEAQMRLGYAE